MPSFEARDHAQQINVAGDNTGVINTTLHYHEAAPPQVHVTSNLPPAPRMIVGRDQELRQILETVDREQLVSIYAIDGMAGIGKTVLTVRAAHALAAWFPDGQYFVELHAHALGHRPADPLEVLARLLFQLGVDPLSIPDTVAGRRDLWRSRLASKKVLVVLDDAADRAQVEPLLPSGPDSLTLITSRHRLLLLPGMQPMELTMLSPDSAADLFLTVGHRDPEGDGERAAAVRIVQLCGYLPLAMVLVAGRVAHHPHWTVAEIAELGREFAAAKDRLAELDTPDDPVVRSAFDLSYWNLPIERQMLFRRLGLHPGLDIDVYAAAALAGVDLKTAKRNLEALYADHLLDELARGRYQLHDLLRNYVRTLSDNDNAVDNAQAMDRLLDYYQHTADVADRWLSRHTRPAYECAATLSTEAGGVVARSFDDGTQALMWTRAERANLMVCLEYTTRRDPARMVAMTDVMAALLRRDGPQPQQSRLHQRAADTAQRLNDRLGEANAYNNLGVLYRLTGDRKRATDLLQQALTLYREIGNHLGEANALNYLGVIRRHTGDYELAADLQEEALTLYREIGNHLGEANALSELGYIRQLIGDYELAADLLQQALTLYREIGNHLGEAEALNYLGVVRRLAGDYELAADLLRQALTLYREIGDHLGEATALNDFGVVRHLSGDYELAADLLQQALTLYREIGNHLGEAEALNGIAMVLLVTNKPAAALVAFTDAIELSLETGSHLERARALDGAARCRADLGDIPTAVAQLREAIDVYRRLGLPEARTAATRLAELISQPSTD